MKRILCLLVFTSIFLTGCGNQKNVGSPIHANEIEAMILGSLTSGFGYCDVSEYYKNNYFNSFEGLNACKIYTCNESTNFDELGILEFESDKSANKALRPVKEYLDQAKEEFKCGIIYNVEEYPKFEAARAEVFGNCIVYTILNKNVADGIFSILAKK